MRKWFTRTNSVDEGNLVVDIHSHLLPGLDDGVESFKEAEEVILYFKKLGYRKIITTPHVTSRKYRNTSAQILQRLSELKEYLGRKKCDIIIEAAAEYRLDDNFFDWINGDMPLLIFGNKFLLFEMPTSKMPGNVQEFIAFCASHEYIPVLAHPERCTYLQRDFLLAEHLLNQGVLFQINVNSLVTEYSMAAQQTAEKFIERGWVHFLGSDCHHLRHVKMMQELKRKESFGKALSLPLMNNLL